MDLDHCNDIRFSPDNRHFAMLDEAGTIVLWNLPFGKPSMPIIVYTAAVLVLAGLFVLTAGSLRKKPNRFPGSAANKAAS